MIKLSKKTHKVVIFTHLALTLFGAMDAAQIPQESPVAIATLKKRRPQRWSSLKKILCAGGAIIGAGAVATLTYLIRQSRINPWQEIKNKIKSEIDAAVADRSKKVDVEEQSHKDNAANLLLETAIDKFQDSSDPLTTMCSCEVCKKYYCEKRITEKNNTPANETDHNQFVLHILPRIMELPLPAQEEFLNKALAYAVQTFHRKDYKIIDLLLQYGANPAAFKERPIANKYYIGPDVPIDIYLTPNKRELTHQRQSRINILSDNGGISEKQNRIAVCDYALSAINYANTLGHLHGCWKIIEYDTVNLVGSVTHDGMINALRSAYCWNNEEFLKSILMHGGTFNIKQHIKEIVKKRLSKKSNIFGIMLEIKNIQELLPSINVQEDLNKKLNIYTNTSEWDKNTIHNIKKHLTNLLESQEFLDENLNGSHAREILADLIKYRNSHDQKYHPLIPKEPISDKRFIEILTESDDQWEQQ